LRGRGSRRSRDAQFELLCRPPAGLPQQRCHLVAPASVGAPKRRERIRRRLASRKLLDTLARAVFLPHCLIAAQCSSYGRPPVGTHLECVRRLLHGAVKLALEKQRRREYVVPNEILRVVRIELKAALERADRA